MTAHAGCRKAVQSSFVAGPVGANAPRARAESGAPITFGRVGLDLRLRQLPSERLDFPWSAVRRRPLAARYSPATLRFGLALGLIVLLALAGCGGDGSTPRKVVRAWSEALRADDNERAASLFAPNAMVVQGGKAVQLRTHEDAVAWNAGLPCSGKIVSLTQNGSAVTATFLLGDRKSRRCEDPPGAEAAALFVVEHGKIILWDQIGSQLVIH